MSKISSFGDIFSSRRRHTRFDCDWSSDVCSSDLARGPARQAHGRGARGGAEDRRLLAAGGDDDQGGGEPRLRDDALRGRAVRAAAVPFVVRARGPERGHGGLSREAQADVQESLMGKTWSVPAFLLAAHILSMLGFATYAALLPELRDLWRLSNTEAGVVGGMFFAGYVPTVSYWTALTDRVDARKVYAAGSLLAAAGGAGFGLLADGFASAAVFQVLLGAGIAATYMPGLRLLSDRVAGPSQSRTIAFYTSSFGIGIALSLALAGAIAPLAGWRAAFIASAARPLRAGPP